MEHRLNAHLGYMAAATNCVRVPLSLATMCGARDEDNKAMRLLALRMQLERFGNIAQANLGPGSDAEQVIYAVFFDVRDARAAKDFFGEACSFGPQEGSLSVSMSRAMFEALPFAVASMSRKKGGHLQVDFFDTRVAAQVAESVALASASVGELSVLSTCDSSSIAGEHEQSEDSESASDLKSEAFTIAAQESAHNRQSLLCCRGCLRESQLQWDDLASGRECRTSLLLRGLPSALCEPGKLQALLDVNGLLELVSSVRVSGTRGRSVGHAVVTSKTVDGVPRLAKFFHGRQYGRSMPIAVSFATRQSGCISKRSIADLGSRRMPSANTNQPKKVSWHLSLGLVLPPSDVPAYAQEMDGVALETRIPCNMDPVDRVLTALGAL